MHTAFTPPSHTITLNKQIYSFQLSPYDYSANLFCAALKNKLILGLIRFPVIYLHLPSHRMLQLIVVNFVRAGRK